MEKLLRNVKKELQHIADEGLNSSNLETTFKLVDIAKDIGEIEEQEQKKMREYRDYPGYDNYSDYGRRGVPGSGRGRYSEGGYSDGGYSDYGRRGVPGSGRGGYRSDDRIERNIERLMEGSEIYRYGRDRYMGGGTKEQMKDGLENMMYAICTLVENLMECAETPEEKEIIHKHLKKMSNL